MPIRELIHGAQVDLVLLVQSVDRRARRDGRAFLKVAFADRTGVLDCAVWDDVDEIEALLVVGEAFRVGGQFEQHERYGAQLKLEGFSPAVEGTYDPGDLRPGPPVPVADLEARLRALVATVRDPAMAAVLEATLGEGTETWARYRVAPAAKRVHQAYRHGLLEHCLTVAEAVSGAAVVFPGIDRDLAVAAALIHDIGKLDAYALGPGDVVEMTDAGRLTGEIVIGHDRMAKVLDAIPGISPVRRQAFLHVILAHHGKLEHGSPVTPQTREALLVHTMDNLGGKLGSVDRMEQERQPGEAWSGFDRAFGGSVWFPESADGAESGEGVPAPASPVAAAPAPAAPAEPSSPPTAHGAPAFTEPESGAEPPALAEPVVPRVAFEDAAWNPPEPESLSGPPLPGAGPLTATPLHEDEPFAEEEPFTEPSGSSNARAERTDDPRGPATAASGTTAAGAEADPGTGSGRSGSSRAPEPPEAQPLPF